MGVHLDKIARSIRTGGQLKAEEGSHRFAAAFLSAQGVAALASRFSTFDFLKCNATRGRHRQPMKP